MLSHRALISISTFLALLLAIILPYQHPSVYQSNLFIITKLPIPHFMGNKLTKSNMDPDAKQLVDNAIQAYPVVIFSKTYCPFCSSAKRDIHAAGAQISQFTPPKIYELDNMGAQGRAIQSYLFELTGRRTVPNVFIGGRTVGGGDEISGFARRGVLKQMLTQASQQLEAEKKGKDTPETIVEDAIQENPVVIFSKTWCPFCSKAKHYIGQSNVDGFSGAKVLELDEMEMGEAIQGFLLKKTGQRTVPNVFVGGKSIGGGDDVEKLFNLGHLQGMIAAAVEKTGAVGKAAEDQAQTSAQDDATTDPSPSLKEVAFGAGCFWGVELAFQRVPGVVSTEVGYSNGKLASVTYPAVCTGMTGSSEVVRVKYDPAMVTLSELLNVWESRHDPTILNRVGNDVGTQYRSGLYFFDEEQRDEITTWMAEAQTRHSKPIVTEIAPVKNYCTAEDYHQKYLEKKGQSAAKGDTTKIRCYG